MADLLALSMRQPWAWLVTHGYKDVENRPWYTHHRGPLLVHAARAARIDREGIEWVRRRFPRIKLPEQYECSGIVGVVSVLDCVTELRSRWFTGPYGLVLASARPLQLVSCPGRLKLFYPDIDVGKALR